MSDIELAFDVMEPDLIDGLLDRWSSARPDLGVRELGVTGRLSRLGQHMADRDDAVFGRFGVSRGEVGLLSALRVSGPRHRLSPTQLGRGLMLSSAGVTSRLDRLERRGLVARLPDPGDRRGIIVELTEEGRSLVDDAVAAKTQSDRQLLARLDAADVEALTVLLRKLLSVVEPPGG
jgi:DNA-binding MarR family transcriptional regulator